MSFCEDRRQYTVTLGNARFVYPADSFRVRLKSLLQTSYASIPVGEGTPERDLAIRGEVWIEPNLFEPSRAKLWLLFAKGSYRYGRSLALDQVWSDSPNWELRRWPLDAKPYRHAARNPTLWYLEVDSEIDARVLKESLADLGWQYQHGWPLALVRVPYTMGGATVWQRLQKNGLGRSVRSLEPVRKAALSGQSQRLIAIDMPTIVTRNNNP